MAPKKTQNPKKTIKKIRKAKKIEDGVEVEFDEEYFEDEPADIMIDAVGEQPEENTRGELSESVKEETKEETHTKDPISKELFPATTGGGRSSSSANMAISISNDAAIQAYETARQERVNRRKRQTDQEIEKELKLPRNTSKELRLSAIQMTRDGLEGVAEWVERASKAKKVKQQETKRDWQWNDDMDRIEEEEEEAQEIKQKRTWGTKRNVQPSSTSTPKKMTTEGLQNTARKDPKSKQEQKGELERITKEKAELQKALETATEGMQKLNLFSEHSKLSDQNWRMQYKQNEKNDHQLSYLMKSNIQEDRRKAEHQVVLKGFPLTSPEEERNKWIEELVRGAGLCTDRQSYSCHLTEIQSSTFRGYSPISVLTLKDQSAAKHLLDTCKKGKLNMKYETKEEWKEQQWDCGRNKGWEQTGNHGWNQGWERKAYKKQINITMQAQQSRFDRTQQLYLRTFANAVNIWYQEHTELQIDWKKFTIWAGEEQVGKLCFSRDGECGVFMTGKFDQWLPELWSRAVAIATGKEKGKWEDWYDEKWEGQNEQERMTNAEIEQKLEFLYQKYYPAPDHELAAMPWRPYFATVYNWKDWEGLNNPDQEEENEVMQEGKKAWENWKWDANIKKKAYW